MKIDNKAVARWADNPPRWAQTAWGTFILALALFPGWAALLLGVSEHHWTWIHTLGIFAWLFSAHWIASCLQWRIK